MGEVSSGDRVNWPSVVMLCVTLAIAFVWIANQVETQAACEERGGVLVTGHGWDYACIRADAVEDLR